MFFATPWSAPANCNYMTRAQSARPSDVRRYHHSQHYIAGWCAKVTASRSANRMKMNPRQEMVRVKCAQCDTGPKSIRSCSNRGVCLPRCGVATGHCRRGVLDIHESFAPRRPRAPMQDRITAEIESLLNVSCYSLLRSRRWCAPRLTSATTSPCLGRDPNVRRVQS